MDRRKIKYQKSLNAKIDRGVNRILGDRVKIRPDDGLEIPTKKTKAKEKKMSLKQR